MTFMGGGFRGNSVKAIKFPSGSRMFAAGNVESGTLVADVPLSFHRPGEETQERLRNLLTSVRPGVGVEVRGDVAVVLELAAERVAALIR
jgi:hypothetical protein